jgi:aminoglycoside 6'-N-acetyltransferase
MADARAFLDYKKLPESQAFISRTVDTLEESQTLITSGMSEPDSLFCALVIHDQVIGDIGGRRYRPESLGPIPEEWDFYLGCSVHPRIWNRGVASAAVALLVPALHQQVGVRRVVAKAFADNEASIRVLTKNGFRLGGTECAAVLSRDGHWLDDCTLAHLR